MKAYCFFCKEEKEAAFGMQIEGINDKYESAGMVVGCEDCEKEFFQEDNNAFKKFVKKEYIEDDKLILTPKKIVGEIIG